MPPQRDPRPLVCLRGDVGDGAAQEPEPRRLELSVRPYVGGGFNYTRYGVATLGGSRLNFNGMGGQGFAGLEFGFANAGGLTVSTEMRYTDFHSAALVSNGGRWDFPGRSAPVPEIAIWAG